MESNKNRYSYLKKYEKKNFKMIENNSKNQLYRDSGKDFVRLKYDLLQKHLTSPTILPIKTKTKINKIPISQHSDVIFRLAYEQLGKWIRDRRKDASYWNKKSVEFYSNPKLKRIFSKRVERSFNKWIKKDCSKIKNRKIRKKCTIKKKATKLLMKDMEIIKRKHLNKIKKKAPNIQTKYLQNSNIESKIKKIVSNYKIIEKESC